MKHITHCLWVVPCILCAFLWGAEGCGGGCSHHNVTNSCTMQQERTLSPATLLSSASRGKRVAPSVLTEAVSSRCNAGGLPTTRSVRENDVHFEMYIGEKALLRCQDEIGPDFEAYKKLIGDRVCAFRAISLQQGGMSLTCFGVVDDEVPGTHYPDLFQIKLPLVLLDRVVIASCMANPAEKLPKSFRRFEPMYAVAAVRRIESSVEVFFCSPVLSGNGETPALRWFRNGEETSVTLKYPSTPGENSGVVPQILFPNEGDDLLEEGKEKQSSRVITLHMDYFGEKDGVDGFDVIMPYGEDPRVKLVPRWLAASVRTFAIRKNADAVRQPQGGDGNKAQ